MKVNPGELDQRVQVLERVRTKNTSGGYDSKERVVCRVWVKIRVLSGGERNEFDQLKLVQRFKIIARTRSDIHADHWINWRGKVLSIVAPNYPGPRVDYMVMDAEIGSAK